MMTTLAKDICQGRYYLPQFYSTEEMDTDLIEVGRGIRIGRMVGTVIFHLLGILVVLPYRR